VEEVDRLTGTAIGRPKSATFRTADLVGLDTLCHVSSGIYENCLDDESREVFKLPNFLKRMLKDNMLGSKTKQGFYKKIADKNGKSQILSLDLKTFEYKEQKKIKF
jgi:3-hydroxyacyl-CoA dehydrogenase